MVGFRNICQTIVSFITRKSPSSDQRCPGHSTKRPTQRVKKRRSDTSMFRFFKARSWLSRQSRGSEGNANSLLSNTSETRKRQRSPSTSPNSRKKRVIDKNCVVSVDTNDEEDLEGPTLVSDEGNNEYTKESNYSPRHEPQETRHSPNKNLDGDTMIDAARTFESEDILESRESQNNLDSSASDENSAEGESDYDSANSLSDGDHDKQPHAPASFIERPKLNRNFTGFEDHDEYVESGTSSESDDSGEEIVIPRPTRRRSRTRRRSGSARSNDSAYRPSPDIVDKDLTSGIVSPFAEESDLSEDEMVEEKVAVRKDDRKEVAYDETMENAGRWTNSIQLPKGRWSGAEKDLYFRLAMRGYEPIIPSNWRIDFATLPSTLFAPPGGAEPYIHPIHGTEFRGMSFFVEILSFPFDLLLILCLKPSAIKFLSDLFYVGNRVRDRVLSGFRPESVIGRYVDNYIKWALKDANLHNRPNSIPLYAMYAMRSSRNSRHALSTLNRRLVTLANRYREAWRLRPSVEGAFEPPISGKKAPEPCYLERKFPIITGFLICGPMIAVLTLNSDPVANPDLAPDTAGKFISQFDFSLGGQDVWNALAIAISVMRFRKNILELMEDCPDDPMWTIEEKVNEVDPDL